MSTTPPSTPVPSATPTSSSALDWLPVIVDQRDRDEFDALVRELASVPTPLAAISDAVMIKDSDTGNIAGVAYIQVRHVVTPIMIVEGAPPNTLNRLMSVFTNQLRATLQETIRATNSNNAGNGSDPHDPHTPTDRHLSYDVYVSDGQQPPDGFERLDVEVWRRRVA
jgi:hypothetical protein